MLRSIIHIILILTSLLFTSCWNDNEGEKLPDFSATTLDGKEIKSSNLIGKIVVIKIWATWCGPCVQEIPELNALVEKYKNDTNIVFLAITDDSSEKISKFLSAKTFDYQHITDAKDLKLLFQPGPYKEIPKHIIVNPKGEIVFDQSGEILSIAGVLEKEIERLKEYF